MPRKPTGQIVEKAGKLYVRATFPNKKRRLLPLTVGATPDEAAAEARILAAAARAGQIKFTATKEPAPAYETASQWWKRSLDVKEAKGLATVGDMRGRFKNWIEPVIGHLAMHAIKADDLRRVVVKLDDAIEARLADDEGITAKTAANVWGEVTSAFREACSSKTPELRIRLDNPTEKVRGPEDGIEREGPVLYPAEFLRLVSCAAVPLERRRYYVAAVYVGPRSNEIAAITAASLDLTHGTLTIDRQRNRKTDGDKATKTKRTRTFPIEPCAVAFFRSLAEARPAGRLFVMPPDELRAALVREDLTTAGVTRAALFVDDKTRHPCTLHDLRHTSLVWMAMRGDDHLRIQFRGGHTDMTTTQRYIARARNLPGGIGEPFPALPSSLVKAPETAPFSTAPEMPGHSGALGGVPNGIRSRSRASDVAREPVSPQDASAIEGHGGRKGTGKGTNVVPFRHTAEARERLEATHVRRALRAAMEGDEAGTLGSMVRAFGVGVQR
jgi:integrase